MQKSVGAVVMSAALSAWCVGDAVAQPAVTSIPAVLLLCPTDTGGESCVPVVRSFVALRPSGIARDAELVRLVAALAEVAQDPRTTRRMCLDIAEGIRVAGDAVSDGGQRDAIRTLADTLCEDTFSTAAIQAGGEDEGDDEGGDEDDPLDSLSPLVEGEDESEKGGEGPEGEDPGGEDPGGEDPGGEDPGGEDPGGEDPGGEDPGGEDPGGEDPGGEDPGGEDPGGEDPGGEDPGGEDPGGEDPGGEDPGGEDPGGEDPGGENHEE